jgi:hypothetical protein
MSDQMPDPFEFLKSLWNPMGLPMPGMVAPTLDIDAVEKKIADLKSVENWLNLNLNMLRLSIQGLEMQKNTLAAMKIMQGGTAGAGAGAKTENNPFPDPAAWWNMMQEAAAKAASTKPPDAPPAEPGKAKPK